MTYPPGASGGYPTGSAPPPRSPWSSPIVLMAIAIGILVVIGAAVGAIALTRGDDSTNTTAATTASASTHTITSTVSGGAGASAPQAPSTQTSSAPTTPRAVPTVSGTDWQGFLGGTRCNASDDPAVAIGRTSRSQIVICQVGNQTGRLYYLGSAPEGSIEIGFPQRNGTLFVANNDGTTYTVSPASLVISKGGQTLANEAMLEYWSS